MNKHIILIFLLLIAISSCSYENKSWDKCVYEDTIIAYQEFLKQYPKGNFTEKAQLRLQHLYNERHPVFRDTKTIKIIVNDSYGESRLHSQGDEFLFKFEETVNKNDVFPLPSFEHHASKIFKYAGLRIIASDDINPDVILRIDAEGVALSSTYIKKDVYVHEGLSGSLHYSGSSLSGSISLEIPAIDSYQKSFTGKTDTSDRILPHQYKKPSDAPFSAAYNESDYLYKLLEILKETYGIKPLINVYKKENDYLIRKAIVDLFMNLNDPNTVAPLIEMLSGEDVVRSRESLDILTKITGEDFGKNQEKWQKWWNENNDKFQKEK